MVTGFNGSTLDGRPTTLGRGGSDFSASIIAAALDATELWIWTDVDGIMTGDPRLIPDARVLDMVTYNEAAELAYNGAKVLHPRTLAPLVEREIPVWSKNSFAPDKPGTKIVPSAAMASAARGPHAVTSMARRGAGVDRAREFGAERHQSDGAGAGGAGPGQRGDSGHHQFQLPADVLFPGAQSELGSVMEHLEESLSLELAHGYLQPIDVDKDVGLIAVVGEGMRGTPGLAGRIFTAISQAQRSISLPLRRGRAS